MIFAFFAAESSEMKASVSSNQAFTFVEVLAALAFLGILMPVLIAALMLSNRAAVVAERSSVAAQLGENQLGQLLVGNAWASGSARGDFGPDYPGYRWELAQSNWAGDAAMTELALRVYFQVQGGEQNISLSTLASQTDPGL